LPVNLHWINCVLFGGGGVARLPQLPGAWVGAAAPVDSGEVGAHRIKIPYGFHARTRVLQLIMC